MCQRGGVFMLYIAGTWILSIMYILNIMYIIVGNIIRFGYWLKCQKVKTPCKNENCRHRYLCGKYREPCTQDDLVAFAELIELCKAQKKTLDEKKGN